MAGAFSGRLVNSYQPNSPFNSSIVTHEAMSFNPAMHGTPLAQQSFSLFGSQPSFINDSISEETTRKIASLQAKLNQKLGPEFISQRPGPGGGPKLTYAEGWKVINLANEVFGFNGWSSSIVSLNTDFVDFIEASGKYNVGVTAIVRVTLRDGTFHEDIGYGLLDNGRQKGAALDKSKKEAVTDAIKRALRNFGNVLGNCLYDKSYTSEIIKMKVPPAKFKKEELHRLPEFDNVKPDIASMSASTSASTSTKPLCNQHQANVTPTRQPMQQNPTKPLSSIPAHVRFEIPSLGPTSNSSSGNIVRGDIKGKGPAHPTSLNTPITPLHPPQRSNPNPQHQPDRNTPMTLLHPPHRSNINPAQHKHQPDCKIPFADHQQTSSTTAVTIKPETKHSLPDSEADESFGFNSDDDAFFALADLGPPIDAEGTDTGRPIDNDEGRPIDSEEGLLGGADDMMVGDDVFDQHQHQKETQSSVTGIVSAPKLSRQEMIVVALMSAENKTDTTSTSDSLQGQETQASGSGSGSASGSKTMTSMAHEMFNKMSLQSNVVNTSLSGIAVRSSTPPPRQQQEQNQDQNQNSSSNLVQQRHQWHMAQRQNRNEIQNPMGSSSRDESKRNSKPSIGGFHFPPGINPLQQVNSTTSNSSNPGIGSKRPAEAMAATHTYKTSGGRPGIGMGLQKFISGPGVSTGTREVLGRLEIGEGGDVKRMRRG